MKIGVAGRRGKKELFLSNAYSRSPICLELSRMWAVGNTLEKKIKKTMK